MAAPIQSFGTTKDGQQVQQYSISNKNGIELRCINYGGRITNLFVPGKAGTDDVMLGFDTLAEYEADGGGQGAFIGRYGNRIRNAAFTMDGREVKLTAFEGDNFLHGSLCHRVFSAELIGDNSVSFTYTSPNGEDGFPGELWIGLIYTLTDENELIMDYRARSDADTHVNLTNHSYYNLAGQTGQPALDQRLWLGCSHFLEIDDQLLPTGRQPAVEGGAFDFTSEKALCQDIEKDDPQLQIAGGYDHCFVIDKQRPGQLAMAAALRDEHSGRTMRVYTTQPGVQLYVGNFLSGQPGKNGVPMPKRGGICLETQHFPDSPNNPDFPSTLLRKGEKYHEATVHQFEW